MMSTIGRFVGAVVVLFLAVGISIGLFVNGAGWTNRRARESMRIKFTAKLVLMSVISIVSLGGGIYGYLLIVPHSMLQMLGVMAVGFVYLYIFGLLGS